MSAAASAGRWTLLTLGFAALTAGVANARPAFRADAWYLPDDSTLGFVTIPAGSFLMGSDTAVDRLAFDNERWIDGAGQRRVEVPDFMISRYEVTVAQFGAFVQATGYRANENALRAPGDHPVGSVSWTDALAYTRWLDGRLRTWPNAPGEIAARLRDGWHVTLPTEAQWEKAARGSDGRIYPWGNTPRRDRANFGGRNTAPVGAIDCAECPYGLLDMSGNVWEWTRTPYRPGAYDVAQGVDLEVDALWVMRGGSFADDQRNVRAAVRGGADPGVRRPFIGFRLVITKRP